MVVATPVPMRSIVPVHGRCGSVTVTKCTASRLDWTYAGRNHSSPIDPQWDDAMVRRWLVQQVESIDAKLPG